MIPNKHRGHSQGFESSKRDAESSRRSAEGSNREERADKTQMSGKMPAKHRSPGKK